MMLILTARVPPTDAAVLPLNACTPEALRALINGAVDGDVVLLPACTISVAGASGDDANASGDFDIATSITLQGVGPDATILDGAALDRVLDIHEDATVTIADLTIRNGSAPPPETGGGIRNAGTLTLRNAIVTANTTTCAGGGIDNVGTVVAVDVELSKNTSGLGCGGGGAIARGSGASLTFIRVRVVGNTSAGIGAGIAISDSTASISDSTIAGNSTSDRGGGLSQSGGGVSASTTVTRSTIAGNRAILGGGIELFAGTMTITNSTVAHNVATIRGGGVFQEGLSNTLRLVNVTVARNADTSNTAEGAGGIAKTSQTLMLENTVVALNEAGGSTPNRDVDPSAITTSSNSFVGQDDGDPQLGPLQDNGGLTQTMLPLPGSPLIDAGSNAVATAAGLSIDQRGLPRFSDGDGSGGPIVDQGAAEFVASAGPANIALLFVSHLVPAPGDTVFLGIVIRAPGRTVVGGGLFFDGFDVSAPLVGCPLIAGPLITGEQAFTCSFPAFLLPAGVHTLSLILNMDDGTTLTDTATVGG
jgi:hypothetical protein